MTCVSGEALSIWLYAAFLAPPATILYVNPIDCLAAVHQQAAEVVKIFRTDSPRVRGSKRAGNHQYYITLCKPVQQS